MEELGVLGLLGVLGMFLLFGAAPAARAEDAPRSTETLVFVRHGEKPAGGFGQISCQGLNRALALPAVLVRKFGKPDFIFAPDPSDAADDPAGRFDYVRPLATIEPTAVALGMPINTQFGFRQIDGLQGELLRPRYRNALVFIAWEHAKAEQLARDLPSADGVLVPRWAGGSSKSAKWLRFVQSTISTAGSRGSARVNSTLTAWTGPTSPVKAIALISTASCSTHLPRQFRNYPRGILPRLGDTTCRPRSRT